MTSTLDATEPPPASGQAQHPEIVMRLHKATGQLAGATRMVEDRRTCSEVLDQLAAVRAAVDAVALLLLSNHADACLRTAAELGGEGQPSDDLMTAVRRYVRTR